MKLFTSIIVSHLVDEQPSSTSYSILVKVDPPLWINNTDQKLKLKKFCANIQNKCSLSTIALSVISTIACIATTVAHTNSMQSDILYS